MGFADQLQPASFRGVSFLVSTENVRRGKKIVLHEYPNTDFRFVEELGKLPPIFGLSAIVHGSDALNQRLRLENALERPGQGVLIHPIYGRLEVSTLDFSVDSSQTNLGQYVFSINFAISRVNVTPTPDIPSANTLSKKVEETRSWLDQKLEKIYNVSDDPFYYDRFTNTLQTVLDDVNDNIRSVVQLSSVGAAKFDRVYRTITNNIAQAVSSATRLRENVALFYTSALDAAVVADQLDAAWTRLTQTPIIPQSTVSFPQMRSQQNELAITEHLRLTSLANSYESKVYTEFTTDEELLNARSFLNTSYKENLSYTNEDIQAVGMESLANDIDVRNSFAELRTLARKIFDDKEKTLYKIVDISPGQTSLALTTYQYYGSLELMSEIISLNPATNHANLNQTIKALSS